MESQYTKHLRELKLGIKEPEQKKSRQPIARKSAKMKMELKKYIPAVKEFLSRSENKYCQIKMKGCKGRAVAVHHSAGRIGAKLHDQEDWIPCCAWCNNAVEIHSLEARKIGVVKTRLCKSIKNY